MRHYTPPNFMMEVSAQAGNLKRDVLALKFVGLGLGLDVLRQTACLVVNPIKVNNFAFLFNCTTVGRASD